MKKILFTYGFIIFLWVLCGVYFVFGLNNEELMNEFGKKEVDDLVWGSLLTTIIYSICLISGDLLDRFPYKQPKLYSIFHSMIVFSLLISFELPWWISFLSIFIAYSVFKRYGFHSKTFMYWSSFSYVAILFFFSSNILGESSPFYMRFFLLNTTIASKELVHLTWIAIIIGATIHFVKGHKFTTPKITISKNKKTIQTPKKEPSKKEQPQDISELF